MALFVGVDAGASHTAVVVGDRSLRVLAREQGEPAALRSANVPEAAQRIARLVERVLLGAGSAPPAAALVVGAAGAGRESERAGLEQALQASQIAAKVRVTTDAAIALQSAFGNKPGLVLAAGTGSIAVGREAKGEVQRVGGWGWQFGDEGSGYALARAAIAAVTRAADGRGPDTRLTGDLLRARGLSTVEDLVAWARSAAPDEIAALAPVVCTAVTTGDPVSHALIEAAARELAYHVDALLARFTSAAVPVALTGGLLQAKSPVRARLVAILEQRRPPVKIVDVAVDPPLGALAIAARLREKG